jgi:hypothetical protein
MVIAEKIKKLINKSINKNKLAMSNKINFKMLFPLDCA